MTVTPDRETFRKLAAKGNLIPLYRDILADMETPVSAFKRLEKRPNAFLLESVEGGERMARYSFLGSDPYMIFRSRGRTLIITENGVARTETLEEGLDPLHRLQEILASVRYVELPDLPRFVGGAVGYIGYDWVRFLEPIGGLDRRRSERRRYSTVSYRYPLYLRPRPSPPPRPR